MKRTKQRECVYELLKNAKQPLTAGEMFAELVKKSDGVCLSTLYRVLEAFVKKNIATKSTVMNGEAVYELARNTHRHYAVCVGCRKMIEIKGCPIEKFAANLTGSGFRVTGHNIEIYGLCRACTVAN
jgi:Fur family ferric uptake transcriptional regulator